MIFTSTRQAELARFTQQYVADRLGLDVKIKQHGFHTHICGEALPYEETRTILLAGIVGSQIGWGIYDIAGCLEDEEAAFILPDVTKESVARLRADAEKIGHWLDREAKCVNQE